MTFELQKHSIITNAIVKPTIKIAPIVTTWSGTTSPYWNRCQDILTPMSPHGFCRCPRMND